MSSDAQTALEIAQIGNPILRQKTKEVTNLKDLFLPELNSSLHKTLAQTANGVAIASPQIFQTYSVFLINYKPKKDDASEIDKFIINPKIIKELGDNVTMWEACLSIPGLFGQVKRKEKIQVEYYDLQGNKIEEELSGFDARIFQHEYDHLEGILYTDKVILSSLMTENEYRQMQKRKAEKQA